MGVGSPDPPQFVYDDEEYKSVFLSGKSVVHSTKHHSNIVGKFQVNFSHGNLKNTRLLNNIH